MCYSDKSVSLWENECGLNPTVALYWCSLLTHLGDYRLSTCDAQQPGGNQLPSVHVDYIEVKETASRAQSPQAHADILNSLSRKSKNFTWIHLEHTNLMITELLASSTENRKPSQKKSNFRETLLCRTSENTRLHLKFKCLSTLPHHLSWHLLYNISTRPIKPTVRSLPAHSALLTWELLYLLCLHISDKRKYPFWDLCCSYNPHIPVFFYFMYELAFLLSLLRCAENRKLMILLQPEVFYCFHPLNASLTQL